MVVATRKTHKLAVITAQQYEEAKDRYMHGESAETIAKDLGCKRNVLDTRFSRDGLPAKRLERLKDGRGERTKQKIAEVVENIADQLAQKTPKGMESLNLHADTAMKAAKTGSILYGWGEQTSVAIIVAGDITGRPVEEEAIDIESATERQQDEENP